jgi:hypothetical protein
MKKKKKKKKNTTKRMKMMTMRIVRPKVNQNLPMAKTMRITVMEM